MNKDTKSLIIMVGVLIALYYIWNNFAQGPNETISKYIPKESRKGSMKNNNESNDSNDENDDENDDESNENDESNGGGVENVTFGGPPERWGKNGPLNEDGSEKFTSFNKLDTSEHTKAYANIGQATEYASVRGFKRDNNIYENACHIQSTPLSDAFFTDKNIDLLLDTLRKSVYSYAERKVGKGIDIGPKSQDRQELISVMRTVLAYYRQKVEDEGPLRDRLIFLNREVIDHLTPKIHGKVISHLRYLRDFDEPIDPMPIPVDSKFTQKEMRLDSYYNSCGNQ